MFVRNYDVIYINIYIYDYGQSDYELILIPSQWGLFIGNLISKSIGVVHWYSDT